jgi:phosphate transport system protein
MDIGLNHLNEQLLTMAGYVEQAVQSATDAWQLRSVAKIEDVYAIEEKVNSAHIAVDDSCFKLLALQQPMAVDLRLILASVKINNDLERMVDLAVNIANNTEYYLRTPPLIDLTDLIEMSKIVRGMVRGALDSFVRSDHEQASQVMHQDDEVDAYKRKIVERVTELMKSDGTIIQQGLNVILIAKNLERVADHATNIAEDVIFAFSGQDVRHPGRHIELGEGGKNV